MTHGFLLHFLPSFNFDSLPTLLRNWGLMDGLYFCRMAVPRFCQTRTGPKKDQWKLLGLFIYGDLLRIVTGDSSQLKLNIGSGFNYILLYFHPENRGRFSTQCDLRIFFHMGWWFNHQLVINPSFCRGYFPKLQICPPNIFGNNPPLEKPSIWENTFWHFFPSENKSKLMGSTSFDRL